LKIKFEIKQNITKHKMLTNFSSLHSCFLLKVLDGSLHMVDWRDLWQLDRIDGLKS